MQQSLEQILGDAQDLHLTGKLPDAIELYRIAAERAPDHAECLYFLGLALFQLGRAEESVDFVRRAVTLDPAVPEYQCDLGAVLFALNDLAGAITAARRALALRGEFPEALFVLGNAMCRDGKLDEGIEAYQRVIGLRPGARDAVNNLGMALLSLGRVDQAIDCFDRILACDPADASAHSNRVYAMHFSPSFCAEDIRVELAQWNRRHAEPLRGQAAFGRRGEADRPLHIGYVSADFRDHVVGWNLIAWLPEHDPERFRVTCYSNVRTPDAVTRQLQSHVHAWRDIAHVSDSDAAAMVRADEIDILVDLSVHTSGNRLLVFARRPAPIQVTYLGYPGSTGLEAMDYRLSDRFLDLPQDQVGHSERTVFLPRSYWCYQPGGRTPDCVPPPASVTGAVTFGCLNQFQKTTPQALQAWQQVLLAVPGSRLVLHAPLGRCRSEIAGQFEHSGITSQRLEFVERMPWPQYIGTYQQIDIALDSFPYGGGITTLDALWMGVPVIALNGQHPVGRSGSSILHNLDLGGCVASNCTEYISRAIAFSADIGQLTRLRSTLRSRMVRSPLTNGRQFARDIESAFLEMWHRRHPGQAG